jgi:hypothetical protein
MGKADYRILLVDDDRSYAQTWIERAFDDYSIDIVHYIPDKFQAIILDAKGKLTNDDSSESMSHIIKALQDLKELEGHGLYYPYLINTGYFDDSVMELLGEVKIFAKGNEDTMFKYLIDRIKCSPYDRLRKKNEIIFSLFDDGHLPLQSGRKLLDVLIFAENPSWRKAPEDFFNPARKILEGVFRRLRELDKIDDKCFRRNEVNLKNCIEYLAGNRVRVENQTITGKRIIPFHIYKSLLYIYEMTSTFSHEYIEETEVSPYALQSVVFALCEVLYWFRDFITLEETKTNTKK